jgi:hypothetical protein
MGERTEEEALAGLLTITVGGRPEVLPVLPWSVSDEWTRAVSAAISDVEMPSDGDGADIIHAMVRRSTSAMLDLIVAYDSEGRLGGAESLGKRIRPAEIRAAFDAIADVADPLGELARLAGEVFGRPMAVYRKVVGAAMTAALTAPLGASTRSPSGGGASATPPSGESGPSSSSGSAGHTRRQASKPRLVPDATRSQMPSARAS